MGRLMRGLALWVFPAAKIFACTCVTSQNQETDIAPAKKISSVVFRGTVLNRVILPERRDGRRGNRYEFTFRVDEYWKGPVGQTVTIYGMDAGTDCLGANYEVGKNYLVFAQDSEVRDVFLGETLWYGWTDLLPQGTRMLAAIAACMPGGESPAVRSALKKLGKGRIPK
jgi:hypothetical protein